MTQATFVFQLGGSECLTTVDAEGGLIADADVADRLRTFMRTAWVPYMATQCVFEEVRFGEAVSLAGDPGEGETNSLPSTCALIMQKNTGTSVRGRMFLPGLSEADTDAGGRVGSELRGLVEASFADGLETLQTTHGIDLRVVSGLAQWGSQSITVFTSRPLIAVLRNRLVTR